MIIDGPNSEKNRPSPNSVLDDHLCIYGEGARLEIGSLLRLAAVLLVESLQWQ
jgi:hypothetical protein